MRLIGLTGPAGCGKDSVAGILCRDHGFVRYAFAKPIKDMLKAIGVDCDTREMKERADATIFGVSPRRMAQTLGTEWMRDTICQDGWLRLAAEHLSRVEQWRGQKLGPRKDDRDLPPAPEGVVITDVRFENEAAWLAERDGVLWHIDRPGVCPVEAHVSEKGLGRYPGDLVIRNDGTLGQLAHTVLQAVIAPTLYEVQL